MNNPTLYPLAMRIVHWLMAALILALLFVGLSMVTSLGVWQYQLLAWHKSCGLSGSFRRAAAFSYSFAC
ncbi:hypothetical protein OURE66S_01572 [Oligella ureolytica]